MLGLIDIYEQVKGLGIVNSGREFGALMNKSQSYLSSSISRKRSPSIEALLSLTKSIDQIIVTTKDEASRCRNRNQIEEYEGGIDTLEKLKCDAWDEIWRRVSL
ncbi:hypothetical protein [Magnetospirillum sp. 15-1]|uniref:hypothetical protein n=1 Tax=Magnetospirillum sp. 15-1 TaxID=1979370 RepID=UPI001143E1A1|nr:hypothetical protein [Magnetospirillum sp. 15-1]